jgi:hypothetical protein
VIGGTVTVADWREKGAFRALAAREAPFVIHPFRCLTLREDAA